MLDSLTTPGHPRLRLSASLGFALSVWPAASLLAQYPGQVAKPDTDTPPLRAVAVLEWTGPAGQPKTSRLVPISIYDGQELQDAGLYLARPQPLALAGEVEYQLKNDGKNIGLFDVENAAQEQGVWVGYGKWKPMPAPKAASAPAKVDEDDAQSDRPILHRKQHGSDSGNSGAGTAPTDPDRPTLHKGGDAGSSAPGNTPDKSSAPPPDSDRPVLHKPSEKDAKDKAQPDYDTAHVESLPDITDPDRPRLKRGKMSGSGLPVVPSLLGLPPDMHQAVAVSDARTTPEHEWVFSWSNPADEAKYKAQVEEMARQALGIAPPPSRPPSKSAHGTAKAPAKTRLTLPPAPAPLEDEVFRVYELAYGSGATMVLTAHTAGAQAQQKFVTLVVQPDLYGGLVTVLKNVTDAAHLDEKPRMRLVDAVDALADNRGELLFELRGATDRQFALYRVLRGTAERLFVTSGGAQSQAFN